MKFPFLDQSRISFCKKGIHAFPSSKSKKSPKDPKCLLCGRDVINWTKIRKRDLNDMKFTFSQLRKDKTIYDTWKTEIDVKARNHALRKGRTELINYVKKRLLQSVGRVFDVGETIRRPYRDGFQTPRSCNIVYYAQHATASCCRRCIERWHGIPQGRDLLEDELDYLTELIMKYINNRVPELGDTGIYVPPIRTGTKKQNLRG
jgi:ribosomal protein L34E